jgi:hypothetical protein
VSLAELLVATALTCVVLGGVATAVRPLQSSFAAEQEAIDLQQRVRVAVETMTRDLRTAASVRPYRVGAIGDDAEAGIDFRPDVIGIHFPAGPSEAESSRTYFLRTRGDVVGIESVGGSEHVLMRYDGRESTFPVLDDVVRLEFEYFGDPEPPRVVGASESEAIDVTYGPAPPASTVDDPSDPWGIGENCTFALVDGVHTPRLPALGGAALVALTSSMLTDGPWCPDVSDGDRFDADLLRVRRVRVHLRLQAPTPFRGPAGPLFLHAGIAAEPRRWVPDQEITVDVSLRNAAKAFRETGRNWR